jgi:hypothetical protein
MSERGGVAGALRSRAFRSDLVAWALAIALVPTAVWATGAWLHRRVRFDVPFAPAPRLERRLHVLAYDRVADGVPGAIGAARIADHLEALRRAEFQPVSLAQVHAAYREGASLPARAVLLTFDGGHRSTYDAVDPLLRRLGWPAVMLLDPRLPEARNGTYLYWDALRRMVDSGIWALGTLGPWPAAPRLLQTRIAASALARVRSGQDPAVGEEAPLVFEDSRFGVSDGSADPAHLPRLRVPAAWTGRQLVERLSAASAVPAAGPPGPPPVAPDRWVSTVGQAHASGDGLELTGAPRGDAWLAGSEWARDFVLEAEVRLERGAFWIVQERAGAREQWRWGGPQGALYLEELRPGAPTQVISQTALPLRPADWHTLRLVKRGGGVWVEWDGAPVADMPHTVSARWRGPVGISTGTPSQPGRVVLRQVRFGAVTYAVRAVSASLPEVEVQALLHAAADVAAVSPPLLVQQGERLVWRSFEPRRLALVAARGAWDVVPAVRLADDRLALRAGAAEELAALAAREGWAGLRLDPGGLSPAARETWRAAVPAWQETFDAHGLRLVLGSDATPSAGEGSP